MEPATIAAIASGISSAAKLFGGGDDQGDSMKKQYAWNMYSARMLPQYQVEGLRLAGLNPMLAVGKGMQSAPAITNNTQDDRAINISRVNSAAQIAQTIAQTRLLDAQKENVEADTEDKREKPSLTRAQTATESVKPAEITERTALIKAQAATEAWGPENKKWATELASAQFGKTVAEKDAIYLWQRKLIEAQKINYEATTKLIQQQIKSAKTKAELDEAYMELERIISMGSEAATAASKFLPKNPFSRGKK